MILLGWTGEGTR